ncbi:FAD-binding oxidoreductase [Oscillatoria sp. FACHB-1407]|uniref:FAD-binding oxidoreductase n=1 Tax=Oscillatoria sp. FACHB-1407 TaxID=2692847 RepID=UPI001687667C|nr:FAD-binding oxidoreductase [Oscillatoria sp. FACHB-1407]MBD2460483.1 FAD-binding oxidoreductase [Oscillatoria sp. FACHB-1407]
MSAIAHQLESIVGSGAVQRWEEIEPTTQARFLSAVQPNTQIECVVYPQTQEELAEVVGAADRDRQRLLICGSGSKLAWGGLASDVKLVVSTARLNRLIDHAVGDLTVTAESGVPLADLQAKLAEANQFLAIDPLYSEQATLGGIVATADTGALRHRYGGIRDMLIGISIVRSDGQRAKAGGRVVKNVAGYDLMKLFTGSYGTLGIISQVTFRVYPLPESSRTVVLTGSATAIAQATQTLVASALTPTSVELVSPHLSQTLGFKAAIALVVRFQSLAVSVEKQAEQLLRVGEALGLEAIAVDDAHQQTLWEALRKPMEPEIHEPAIVVKLGVLPNQAVSLLDKLSSLIPEGACAIHAGSGLGMFRGDRESLPVLPTLRQLCEAHQGFLTVLNAPTDFKRQFDLWGYTGNALSLMQQLKCQFDPHQLLNPQRFVSGI